MMYERASPIQKFDDRHVDSSENQKKLYGTLRASDALAQAFVEPEASLSIIESQRRLKMLVHALRKVLTGGQAAIVVIVPHIVHWITPQSQQQLGGAAGDVNMIAEALESKLGGPNSELVAEHVVRASTRAQLGIQNRNTIELHASSTKSYKVDLDCYFEDPELPAIVALLTPIKDSSKTGYEEAQLSSMRYHIGIMNSRDEGHPSNGQNMKSLGNGYGNHHVQNRHRYHHQHHPYANPKPQRLPHSRKFQGLRRTRAENGTEFADLEDDDGEDDDEAETHSNSENHFIHDFIPSMICQELDYFYAMLPESDNSVMPHHELELSKLESVLEHEQQAMDPDVLDPHICMRLNQQRSLSPVLPRRPRDPAEVQNEIERARLMARSPFDSVQGGNSNSQKKHGDIICLECGTDTSPEWRKGPNGPKTLCNRCGLRFAKKLRQQR